jgi:hypothetical protein
MCKIRGKSLLWVRKPIYCVFKCSIIHLAEYIYSPNKKSNKILCVHLSWEGSNYGSAQVVWSGGQLSWTGGGSSGYIRSGTSFYDVSGPLSDSP